MPQAKPSNAQAPKRPLRRVLSKQNHKATPVRLTQKVNCGSRLAYPPSAATLTKLMYSTVLIRVFCGSFHSRRDTSATSRMLKPVLNAEAKRTPNRFWPKIAWPSAIIQ